MTEPLDLSRIQAICFDLDGTLIDTDEKYVARAARWLRPISRILPDNNPQAYARRVVMAVETPVNAALGLFDRFHLDEFIGPLLDKLHRSRGLAAVDEIRLIPGALATLERLAPHFPLGIATSRDRWSAAAILDAEDLNHFFQCVASARTTLRAKPHPQPIIWAAGQLGVHPQSLLMVGDTTVDIRAGRAAGAQTAGVLSGFGEKRELTEAGANVIFERTLDLVDLLLNERINA
ncbi:MAG: HAD-IA family hydrolase [Anaerolineales bacterium]|nr:HAD-IA family hydrolase [Anaerolineales bacterium]